MSRNIVLTDYNDEQVLPITTSENVYTGAGTTLKDTLKNIEEHGSGGALPVDAELSYISENPVQNKVITEKLRGINLKVYIGSGSYDKDTNTVNINVTNFEDYDTGTLFVGVFSSGFTIENNATFKVNNAYIGEPNSLKARTIGVGSIVIFGMSVVSGVPKVIYADQSMIDAMSSLETDIETAISNVDTKASNSLTKATNIEGLINREVFYGIATYDSDNNVIDLVIPDYTHYDTKTLFFGEFENDIELNTNTTFSVNGVYIGEPQSLTPRSLKAGLVPFEVKTVSGVPRVVFLDDITRAEYVEQKIFEFDKANKELKSDLSKYSSDIDTLTTQKADYEEGIWTPIISSLNNSDISSLYVLSGEYIKNGKTVWVAFIISLTSAPVPAFRLNCNSLPFAPIRNNANKWYRLFEVYDIDCAGGNLISDAVRELSDIRVSNIYYKGNGSLDPYSGSAVRISFEYLI